MRSFRTLAVSMLAAALVAGPLAGTSDAATKKPVFRTSPSHLQTAKLDSIQFWVTNGGKKPAGVVITQDKISTHRTKSKPGVRRVSLRPIEQNSTSDTKVEVYSGGKLRTLWKGSVTRPLLTFATRAAERIVSGKKRLVLSLESKRAMTEWTNAVISTKDGRSAKCLRKDFVDNSNYSPYCEFDVPGDFRPNQVSMGVATKNDPNASQRVKVMIDIVR